MTKAATLEEYLLLGLENEIIDHVIRARVTKDDKVVFYIHPLGKDGETQDFHIQDNELTLLESPLPA